MFDRIKDPQIVLEGIVKPCRNNDTREIIVATLLLSLFEVVLVINVPVEGEDKVKIYAKFKVSPRHAHSDRPAPHRMTDRSEDKRDARDDASYETGDTGEAAAE
jgi:hypothetical protein